MRKAGLVALLLAAPWAAASTVDGLPFEASPPAQVSVSQASFDVEWFLVVSAPADRMEAAISAGGGLLENFTGVTLASDSAAGQVAGSEPVGKTGEQETKPFDGRLSSSGWSSLYAKGGRITVSVATANATLELLGASKTLDGLADGFGPEGTKRQGLHGIQEEVIFALPSQALEFEVEANALEVLEWHNLTIHCEGQCISTSKSESLVTAGGLSLATPTYQRLAAGSMVEGAGTAWAMVLGGTNISTAGFGSFRLPNAEFPTNCGLGCEANGQTFAGAGEWSLRQLQSNGDGRFRGTASGDFSAVRIDEADASPLLPLTATTTAVAATVGGVILGLKALLGLFARRRDRTELLSHPKRRLVMELIQQAPGVSLLELARRADLSKNTAKHHVDMLTRTGLVHRQEIGQALCFFPAGNGGNRHHQALLQDQDLRRLFEELSLRPGITQKDVLALTSGLGWRRSTTQHRLGRLVDAGLIATVKSGRVQTYHLKAPVADQLLVSHAQVPAPTA